MSTENQPDGKPPAPFFEFCLEGVPCTKEEYFLAVDELQRTKGAAKKVSDAALRAAEAIRLESAGLVYQSETFVEYQTMAWAEIIDRETGVANAKVAKLVEALESIANQQMGNEMSEETFDSADFETGYDACIAVAREVRAAWKEGSVE